MKILKKLTAFVLAALMCTGCLAGCGTSPDKPDQELESLTTPTHQATEPAGQEQTAPPTQPETPTEPAGDTETVWVMSKEILYDAEGFVRIFAEYTFDERGLRTGGKKYQANGELIEDVESYTYIIEDNVVTRYCIYSDDGTTADAVYQFTFDEGGFLQRVYMDLTSLGVRMRDWIITYDENGHVLRIEQYQDYDGNHQDTPCQTQKFEFDESTHILSSGDQRFTLDENGLPVEYAVIDRDTGEYKRDIYYCFEYTAIEVPAEYAAVARAMTSFFPPMYD